MPVLFIAAIASTLVVLAGVLARRQGLALAGVVLVAATACACVLTRSFALLTGLLAVGAGMELAVLARVVMDLLPSRPAKATRRRVRHLAGLAGRSWST